MQRGRPSGAAAHVPPAIGSPPLLVVGELGHGAGTVIYRVRRDGRDYALKLLSAAPPDPEGALLVFRREAALLASVDDPGLPRIHEVGQHEGRPFLVMDLVEGRDLGELLAAGPLPEARALRLAIDVADTLDAVHRIGLVHRDLKPQNIMVLDDGRARLIDFDLATWQAARWQGVGAAAVGTLQYAAPEQSGVLKRPVDNRSDLYSLGVVLFECLAGRPPFGAADVGELLRLHAAVAAPDIRSLVPAVSDTLAGIITRLLAKDPDDRYQTGAELAGDLRRLATAAAGLTDDQRAGESSVPDSAQPDQAAEPADPSCQSRSHSQSQSRSQAPFPSASASPSLSRRRTDRELADRERAGRRRADRERADRGRTDAPAGTPSHGPWSGGRRVDRRRRPGPDLPPRASYHRTVDGMLGGREAEMARLLERWQEAIGGHGGVCLIRGAPGIGKSRLAGELAERVRDTGGLVLSGTCAPGDPMPLAPLRAAVDAHLRAVQAMPPGAREQAGQWLDAAVGPAAPLLAALSPALAVAQAEPGPADEHLEHLERREHLEHLEHLEHGAPGDHPEPREHPEYQENRFVAAVVGFLAELARVPGGLLLQLDDVQWLDPRTRQVLAELAAELPRLPLLVVTTANDSAEDTANLIDVATSLGAVLDLEISLRPLSEEAVADLVSRQLPGIDIGSRLGRLLTTRTNGNPLLVQEYVRAIVDAGLLWPSWGRWLVDEEGLNALDLPSDALGVILARLGRLGPDSRRCLQAGAAIGRRFTVETVSDVCGIERSDVLAAMNEAAAHRLIEPRGRRGYAFLHDRIRAALLEGLDADAVASLHRRIAEALEGSGAQNAGAARVYQIAHHYMLGRITGTGEGEGAGAGTGEGEGPGTGEGTGTDRFHQRVFRACYAAGRLALEEHAVTEAVAFLEYAANCGIPLDSRFRHYLGTALNRDGRFAEAQAQLVLALETEPAALRRAAILAELAHGHRTVWNTAEAAESVRRGLAELNSPQPKNRLVLFLVTVAEFVAGAFITATKIGFGSAKGWRRERHTVLAALHEAGAYIGTVTLRPEILLLHTMRGFFSATRLGAGRQYALGRASLGIVLCLQGRARRGRLHLTRAAQVAEGLGDPRLAAQVAWYEAAMTFLTCADDGEAWRRVLDEHGRWLDTGFYADTAASMVWENIMRGRCGDARTWAERGLRRLRSDVESTSTSMITMKAVLDVMCGRFGGAAVELGRVAMLLDGRAAWGLQANLLLASMYAGVEQQEFGWPFEDLIARSVELGLTAPKALRPHRHFFTLQAFGRLAQCRNADEEQRSAALIEADNAVRLLSSCADSTLVKAFACIAEADLLVLQDRAEKALGRLGRLRPPHPDAPLVSFEAARTRARALLALGHREEALRQARSAQQLATEHDWAHRARWISAEFGLGPVNQLFASPATGVVAGHAAELQNAATAGADRAARTTGRNGHDRHGAYGLTGGEGGNGGNGGNGGHGGNGGSTGHGLHDADAGAGGDAFTVSAGGSAGDATAGAGAAGMVLEPVGDTRAGTGAVDGAVPAGVVRGGVERQRLAALAEVSRAARRVIEPESLARITLDETIRILAADRAFLFLVDANGNLRPYVGRDAHGDDVPEPTGYSVSIVERVRRTREALVVTGTDEGAALGAHSAVRHGLRSIIAAPLQLEGRLLGVVYLDSQVAKGIFTADDLGILGSLTVYIATSMETARAAQLELTVQAARRQRELAEALHRALAEMSATLDPGTVLTRLLETAPNVVGCDDACLVSREGREGLRVTRAGATGPGPVGTPDGRPDARPDGRPDGRPHERPEDPITTALLRSWEPVVGGNGPAPGVLTDLPYPARSWLSLPLITRGTTLGVLLLASAEPGAFQEVQVEMAGALVAQGLSAYDNAILFARVQELAIIDELTGVANRRHFFESAEHRLAAACEHGPPVAGLMIDIDDFKIVNDTHGHATGDDVIRAVAGRLLAEIRDGDVIGRYGGEEFALLIDVGGDPETAMEVAERIRAKVADSPVTTRSGNLRVTVSIGVAAMSADEASLGELLGRADEALYQAKRDGRNRIRTG